ncbi:MAG: hypothetical protein AAGL19_06935 [Pseudomonadota bacterium]
MKRTVTLAALLSTAFPITAAMADNHLNCGALFDGEIKPDCEQANQGDVVTMPVPELAEPDVRPVTNNSGFSLSLDGDALDSDPTLEDRIRTVDLNLANADVQISFDGFDPTRRLAVEAAGSPRAYQPGETVTLQSELNYPAFVARGEFRIFDAEATGGPRLLAIVPVSPGGQATTAVPDGNNIVVVHRVYGQSGRYDETVPFSLSRADRRGLTIDVEDGADTLAAQNIRINGGTVTVAASNVPAGAVVQTLGTSVRPDANGRMVVQRILPPGDYDVDVRVTGGNRPLSFSRPLEVPSSEWFYFGVADLTFANIQTGDDSDLRTTLRLQGFADGQTASGVNVTASIDTDEEEIGDLFRRLDEKDPRSVLDRIDPEDTYPTFGDDSTIEDLTPTSGKVYIRVEKDGNFALWGDYQARLDGSAYVRNERTLYGAQVGLESQATTEDGEARRSLSFYAAEPDQLVGRETFRGTGGSVYFLRRNDVTPGTETITVQVRDADTGRLEDTILLVAGRDYEVNYLQGVVTLTAPLTGTVTDNLIVTNPGGDQTVNLVVQYEYTPTASDISGFSTGGRAEAWVGENLRFGISGTADDTGTSDQTLIGADLRYEFGENSFVQLDVARSDGPGYDNDFSINGGLVIDGTPAVDGTGTAVNIEAEADLRDLGYARDGAIGGYFEQREEGFATLDYQVTAATGDETFFGGYYRLDKTDTQLGFGIYADVYENDAGSDKTEIGVEIAGNLSPKLSFEAGLEQLDETTATTNGSRTDLAARFEYEANPDVTYAFFGQGTVSNSGLEDYNRVGVGIDAALSDNWRLEAEVSEGSGGVGGRLLASYEKDGSSRYFGYELDRGRALQAGVNQSDNGGKFIAGGRQKFSDDVTVYGENIYDIFGGTRTLTTAYGVDYQRSDFLSYDASIEHGKIDDELERTAVGFGMNFDDEALRASARLEFRVDEADPASAFDDLQAVYFDADARYKIDEERRLLFSFGLADADSDTSTTLGGQVIDANLGYAFRPINNERLNALARVRYLKDGFGQTIDGVAGAGDTQESTVFSLEANYDLSRQWTIGGKVGGRLSQTDDGTGAIDNDAYLAVINARYHLVHKWDFLLEARHLDLVDAGSSETAALGAAYRHIGNNAKIGVGYNFGSFSDDLTDIERDDKGLFLNIIAKF